jgi:rubrerythrin
MTPDLELDPPSLTRGRLLGGLVAAGAGAIAGGAVLSALPDDAGSAPSARLDQQILNFGLLLEDIQAAFYAEALRRARLAGELRTYAQVVGGQEREHARFIRSKLGSKANPRPRLDFGDDTADAERFARSALRLEDLGVKAYFTQAANLTPAALAQLTRIATVESRHAAWIRDLSGLDPAPDPVEPTLSAATVRKTLEGSGYVR